MKTVVLSTLITFLFVGVIFGAPAADVRDMEKSCAAITNPCFRLTPLANKLKAISERLDLQAKSAYWQGNFDLAAKLYQRLVKKGGYDCHDIYNLACCYGQLGNAEEAARYIRLSVEAGFNDVDHINNDPDFQKIKDSPYFQMTVDWLGKELSRKIGK